MASGFGTSGSVGRCYPFWKDFAACVVSDRLRGKLPVCSVFAAFFWLLFLSLHSLVVKWLIGVICGYCC